MAYFDWGPDMAIDHGPIDEDHRTLVAIVNELHTATSCGDGKTVVADLLDALITSTQEHLRREEELMRRAGFADLERHAQGHAAFVARLHELQRKHQAGSITVAAQLSSLLRDWLSLHIRRSDRELLAHLGVRRPS